MDLVKKILKRDSVEWHVLCASNLWLVRQANPFQQNHHNMGFMEWHDLVEDPYSH